MGSKYTTFNVQTQKLRCIISKDVVFNESKMIQKTSTSDTKTKEEESKLEKTCRGGANKA